MGEYVSKDIWKGVSLIEKTKPPYPLYFVKPHMSYETSPGHYKQDPAIKIEWKENAHGEFCFDIDDYCSKEAYVRSMQGLCPMSDAGRKGEAKKLRQEIINKIERLPEWEAGLIQPYVPFEESSSKGMLNTSRKDTMFPQKRLENSYYL